MSRWKVGLSASASLLYALVGVQTVRAQVAASPGQDAQQSVRAKATLPRVGRDTAPETPKAPDSGLETITVTALQRKQNLVKTPAAVQAFSARDIKSANITRPKDFIALTPNVSLVETNHAGEAFVVIRGEAPARNAESSVAIVIDGVQQSSPNEFNADLFDIQQIEVLKGPQGALYGRNAVGGAIIINTRQPTDDFHGFILGSVGNGPSEKLQGSISGPIVKDKLLFKADVSFRNFDGLYTNVNTGEHVDRTRNVTGRGLLVWTPQAGTRVELRAGASDLSGGAIAFNPQFDLGALGGLPPFTDGTAGYNCIKHIDSNNLCVPFVSNVRSYDRQNKNNQSIKIVQDLPWGQVVSVTGHSFIRDVYGAGQFPYGFGPTIFGPDESQWVYLDNDAINEDLRFISPADRRLRFIAGVYLLHEDSDRKTDIRLADSGVLPSGQTPTLSGFDQSVSFRSDRTRTGDYAFYANVDYDILSNLTVTGAFRYDKQNSRIDDRAPAPYSLDPGQRAKAIYSKPQPKVTVRYSPLPNASVYASYSEGFKSGGFNPFNSRELALRSDPNTVVQDQFRQESTRDYEVGFHSRFFDNRLLFNGAAYYSIARNAQVFEFFPLPSLQANANVDKAQKSGFEFDAAYNVLEGLTVNAGFGYSYAKIATLAANPLLVGNRMPYAPLTQTSVGVQYQTKVSDIVPHVLEDWTVVSRIDYQRLGSTYWDIYNTPGTRRDPVNLVNLRMALQNGRWTFAGWGKNVFNERYIDEAVVLNSAINVVHPAQKATFGFDLSYQF